MEKSIAPSQSQKALIHDALEAKNRKDVILARHLYDEAIALGDHGYLAHAFYNKGVLLMELGANGEALQCFQEAVAINPAYEKAWVNLGSMQLAFDRYREALYAFDKAISIFPDQPLSRFNKGMALNRLGRHAEALKTLSTLASHTEKSHEALQIFGDHAFQLYRETALAHLQTGDLQAAGHYYRLAFNLNSSDFESCVNLAYVYDQLKEHDEALLFYDLAIAMSRNNYKGYQGKACTFIHMQRYQQALECIVKAIELAPDNFEPFYNLACIYAGLNQRDNVINALKKTAQLLPPTFNLGSIVINDPDLASVKDDPEVLRAISK